ncbi:MAG: dipeptide epimerase [Polyangiaceae bacterium]|nr:dipeptide epimerase [Polyangiaceae bacterium]
MVSQSLIDKVSFLPLNVPLKTAFGIAGGVQASAENVLVKVELADGTVGLGEAAPLPAYNGETQASTLHALERGAGKLVGLEASGLRPIAKRLTQLFPHAAAAQCALETAVFDAFCRQKRMSMWSVFGGSEKNLESDITIVTGTVDDAYAFTSRYAEQGFQTFKIKVGGGDRSQDLERVKAVRDAAPKGKVFLDANASLSARDAIWLVKELEKVNILPLFFEQPTHKGDWEALFEVANVIAVAVDENVTTPADALHAARLGPPHLINLKIMKSGIVNSLDIAAVARAAGMGLMVGGNVESILAMSVSAALAGGLGGVAQVDLDTPLFFAENPFEGGFTMSGPHITIGDSPGHGVSPRR